MMRTTSINKPLVLIAEDNPDDAFLLREAILQSCLPVAVSIVSNGEEAVKYLTAGESDKNSLAKPRPDLLVTDLKMPRMNGFELLSWLRSDPRFRQLPVVVLSNSSIDLDIQQALNLGASDFRTKPLGIENLTRLFCELHAKWLAPTHTKTQKTIADANRREPHNGNKARSPAND